ncbi:hypothetical protein GCM10027074_43680 [Streptomyces deserti]
MLEGAGRARKDAGKRLAAVHRAIWIREKWMGPFPPRRVDSEPVQTSSSFSILRSWWRAIARLARLASRTR